jgi:uncharacterized membrane protein YfcA
VLLLIAAGVVAALYATVGQVGGSGFVAVLTFANFEPGTIRATAFALNIVAASYATLHIYRTGRADWKLLGPLLTTSIPASLLGGIIVLHQSAYYAVTGVVLLLVAVLMAFRVPLADMAPVRQSAALVAGAVTGLASGVTGVGGGIFLAPILILFAKVSPKSIVALSPPFILANSVAALIGLLVVGQAVPLAILPLAGSALLGSVVGMAIGLRFMSARAIQLVLALILLSGGIQMLFRAIH